MPDFLYFIPTDRPVVSIEMLRSAGLSYALDDDAPAASGVRTTAGPDGLAGLIVRIDRPGSAPPVGYSAQRQLWRKAAAGAFYVGLENGPPPMPADLARSKLISGETVKLADQNEWIIPICFSIVRGTSLPKALVLGEDGQTWTLEELPAFLRLCRDAEKVWDAFRNQEGDKVTMDGQEAPRVAVDALSVNYRIGPIEASMLKLLTTEGMWRILENICDIPAVKREALEHQKKHAAAGC